MGPSPSRRYARAQQGVRLRQVMAFRQSTVVINPDFIFRRDVESVTGGSIAACYRCLKCTAGCPMAEEMDCPPDRLMRMIQLGLRADVLGSRAIWLCSGCLACSERCPNGIDVAGLMDHLKGRALAEGYVAGEPRIADFHQTFLSVVRRYGRLHEATLVALLKLRSRDLLGDLASGLRMLIKGKIPAAPERVRRTGEVASLFKEAEGAKSIAGGSGRLGRNPRPPGSGAGS